MSIETTLLTMLDDDAQISHAALAALCDVVAFGVVVDEEVGTLKMPDPAGFEHRTGRRSQSLWAGLNQAKKEKWLTCLDWNPNTQAIFITLNMSRR